MRRRVDANQDEIVQTLVMPGERPRSWNEYWSGVHWRVRKDEADRVHIVVRAALDPSTVFMFDGAVDIDMIAYFTTKGRKRQLDSPNIVSKPYIDALIGWYIQDDSRKYVRRISTQSEIDNEAPRVEIIVTSVEDAIRMVTDE